MPTIAIDIESFSPISFEEQLKLAVLKSQDRVSITKMMNKEKWKCPKCAARQIQLTFFTNLMASLKCRECSHYFEKQLS